MGLVRGEPEGANCPTGCGIPSAQEKSSRLDGPLPKTGQDWLTTLRLDVDRREWDNVGVGCFVRLLLSFAILACPFNCMGAFEGGDAQTVASPACSCCSNVSFEPNTAPNRLPESPDDDCPCPTCFCNGAVLPADSLAGDVDDGLQPSDSLVVASLEGESQSTSASVALADRHFPTFLLSGRFVRILHESFLL